MKTEEEARKCWCPFARYTHAAFEWKWGGINRWIDTGDTQLSPEPARCIASECMAWRMGQEVLASWSSKPKVPPPVPDDGWEPYGDVYETTDQLPKPNRDAGERQFAQKFRKRSGYCGLAGKP